MIVLSHMKSTATKMKFLQLYEILFEFSVILVPNINHKNEAFFEIFNLPRRS